MGKYSEGKNSQTVGLSFATNAPLDDRTVVKTKDSLIGKDTWVQPGYLFNGLITAVQETQELYMYIGGSLSAWPSDFLSTTTATTSTAQDTTIAKYWKKVSSSGLENISGVFTFKGLAEAVSPDLSYIVTCSAKSEKSIFPVGTAADLVGDLYYGWETEGDRFWTDSSILNSASTQYIQGTGVLVWGVEYKDDFYFPVNAMPAGGDEVLIELQNSNGDSIFLTDGAFPITAGTQYSVYNSENDVIGIGLGFSYTGYTFTESIDPYPISHTHTTIQANEANSGHVYQIGENEYASNGQIWVKLGSPVEDWIIL